MADAGVDRAAVAPADHALHSRLRPFEHGLGWLWTVLKGYIVAIVVIWMRISWPRLREDQLQRVAWVWLVPIALFQLALTAVGVVMSR